ncbi:hypothetical protein BDV40DRAFT_291859 [Aspergillus tamarii]|uniref:Uncharacterized protein n=1 Tax=Aspergillus tamarii TaxID=41984 RepID=A0A5N6UIV1_ASPTM|nr:hypothetical protein BDV40DRAFT_291859 [Aspergillus tamarii]
MTITRASVWGVTASVWGSQRSVVDGSSLSESTLSTIFPSWFLGSPNLLILNIYKKKLGIPNTTLRGPRMDEIPAAVNRQKIDQYALKIELLWAIKARQRPGQFPEIS